MVAKLMSTLAVLLLAASCTGVFDSYFPASVEYLENRVDLKAKLGHPIVSVRMQLLQAAYLHSYDVLVVIATTNDGEQTVLFYDGQLKLRKTYSEAQLATVNGGVSPDLYPILQDYYGLHTGQIEYDIASREDPPVARMPSGTMPDYLTPGSSTAGGGFSHFRSTYYEDLKTTPSTSYPSLFSGASGGGNIVLSTASFSTKSLYDLATTAPFPLPGTLSNSRLLDVTCWDRTYRFAFGSGSSLALISLDQLDDPTLVTSGNVVMGKPKGDGIDLNEGWATATAAVVRSHGDNASDLVAFSWAGKELGRLRTTSSNDAAFAFHPSGEFWYAYDPATGMVSQYKAWW